MTDSPLSQSTMLLVTGPHRSGTSALTELLYSRGADIAPDLLEPQAAINQRGFWEDAQVVDLNEQILTRANCNWYEITALDESRLPGILGEAGLEQARQHVREFYGANRLSVCKDPRFCRSLPFWLPLLRELAIRPAPILMLRHPAAVAASLHARDGLPPDYCCLLWLIYLRDALQNLAGLEALVIDYTALLQSPQQCLEKVADRFNINWQDDSAPNIIQSELCHQLDSELPLDSESEPGATVYWLYRQLRSSARLDVATCERYVTRIDNALGDDTGWRSQMSSMARQIVIDQAALQNIGTLHSGAMEVIAQKDSELDRLAAAAELSRETIAEKDGKLAELSQLWESADSAIVDKDRDLARLAGELEHAGNVVKERDNQLTEITRMYQGWAGLPLRLMRKWQS